MVVITNGVAEIQKQINTVTVNGFTWEVTDEQCIAIVNGIKAVIAGRSTTPVADKAPVVEVAEALTKVKASTPKKSAKQTKAPKASTPVVAEAPKYKHCIYDAEWKGEWKDVWTECPEDPEVHHIDSKGNKWMHPYNAKAYNATTAKKHADKYVEAGFCKA